ncbi:hypothetical protein CPG37_10800 [Malaciobacter canalis]|uniref:Uncharacterized protein n=1 Tax=Malaciobacter canalis TaxID=1912871 RepID=A0ABX4LN08_9BACT|nr:hypothetical protein [Malaciobacter canalis]PHO09078.1 hypothetical protein CPG37_10800 [Malaciobacter canalis]QEE31818.1 hypothetical protein ACAN_0307 [Malaciobacter canalis]
MGKTKEEKLVIKILTKLKNGNFICDYEEEYEDELKLYISILKGWIEENEIFVECLISESLDCYKYNNGFNSINSYINFSFHQSIYDYIEDEFIEMEIPNEFYMDTKHSINIINNILKVSVLRNIKNSY